MLPIQDKGPTLPSEQPFFDGYEETLDTLWAKTGGRVVQGLVKPLLYALGSVLLGVKIGAKILFTAVPAGLVCWHAKKELIHLEEKKSALQSIFDDAVTQNPNFDKAPAGTRGGRMAQLLLYAKKPEYQKSIATARDALHSAESQNLSKEINHAKFTLNACKSLSVEGIAIDLEMYKFLIDQVGHSLNEAVKGQKTSRHRDLLDSISDMLSLLAGDYHEIGIKEWENLPFNQSWKDQLVDSASSNHHSAEPKVIDSDSSL